MPFGMSNAKSVNKFNRDKLQPGQHLVKVRDIRENNGFHGHGFFIDFTVISGPTQAGFQASASVYPDNARPSEKMSREEAVQRDLGKVQRWTAACAGLDVKRQGEITDPRYEAAIARPVSPLAGRLVVVMATPHTNAKKEETVYYDFFPYDGPDQVDVKLPEGAVSATAPTVAPPALPPIPPVATRPTFEQAMAAAGYAVHPANAEFVYNASEAIPKVALAARLGY